MLAQEVGRHPRELRAGGRHGFDAVQHLRHRERRDRSRRVERAERLVLGHAHRPLGDVARVDDLHRIVAVARREDFAALVDAIRPVGEAIGPVQRTDDQSGPNDRVDAGILFFDFLLGVRLERPIELSKVLTVERVRVEIRRQRRRRLGLVGVRRSCRSR